MQNIIKFWPAKNAWKMGSEWKKKEKNKQAR